MKRLWILLFCMALLVGCSGEPEVITSPNAPEQPFEAEIAADTVGIPEQTAAADLPTASPTPDMSMYTDEQRALIERFRALPEYYPQWYGETPQKTGTAFSVTVRETRKSGGATEFVYHNETLDFADLKLSVLAFDPASETEALRLSVAAPQGWSETVTQWFFEDGLRLDFLIGAKHVNAFRERTVTKKSGGFYEIAYARCILDEYDLSQDALVITPYVREASLITLNSDTKAKDENGRDIKVPVSFHLDRGDVAVERCNTSEGRIARRDEVRHSLTFASVTVPLSGTHLTRPPLEILLPVEVEDFAYSEQIGLLDPSKEWHDDPNMSPRGMLYSRKKDFNEVSFTVDAFRIREDEMELVVSWYLPDDWTDAECRAFDLYDAAIFLDDRHPDFSVSPDRFDSDDFDIESYPSIFSMPSVDYLPGEHNFGVVFWESRNWREAHVTYRSTVPQQGAWKDVHSITIIPKQRVYSAPLPEEGSPYGAAFPRDEEPDQWDFYNRGAVHVYRRWMKELAITVDITPDLFDSGL